MTAGAWDAAAKSTEGVRRGCTDAICVTGWLLVASNGRIVSAHGCHAIQCTIIITIVILATYLMHCSDQANRQMLTTVTGKHAIEQPEYASL